MSDDTPVGDRLAPDGDQYRVKDRHPRRDGPLVVSDAAGTVIAASGDTCERCTVAQLASMIQNGYVERIDPAAPAPAVAEAPVVAERHPRRRAGEV